MQVQTVLTEKGIARKQAAAAKESRITDREIAEETKEVKTLLPDVKKHPARGQQVLQIISEAVPKIEASFNSLEKARRSAEQEKVKEEKKLAQYEEYIVQKLLKLMEPDDAKKVLELMLIEQKEEEKGQAIEIKNRKRVIRGKKPAGHLFKKHFDNAGKLAKEERKEQLHMVETANQEQAVIAEMQQLVPGLPKTSEKLSAKIQEFLQLVNIQFHHVYEFEWDVDEEEAMIVDSGKFYLAAIRQLSKKGMKNTERLEQGLTMLIQRYQQGYLVQDLHQGKKLLAYMNKFTESCGQWLKDLKTKEKTEKEVENKLKSNIDAADDSFWDKKSVKIIKKFLYASGLMGQLARFFVEKDFRDHTIKHAPKLLPVIYRAIKTKGISLLNPADLYIVLDYGVNDPETPPKVKDWCNKFLHSEIGEKILALGTKKASSWVKAKAA